MWWLVIDEDVGATLGVSAQVVQPGPHRIHSCFSAQLVRHKRVDQPTEEIAVTHDHAQVGADGRAPQAGVGDEPFRPAGQTLEAVAAPCRKLGDDTEIAEQSRVCERGAPVQAGGLVEGRVVDDPGGVQRIGLEELGQRDRGRGARRRARG